MKVQQENTHRLAGRWVFFLEGQICLVLAWFRPGGGLREACPGVSGPGDGAGLWELAQAAEDFSQVV
ncbi:MAG: hypothetical protein ACFNYG_03835, partial [Lautropia mirabilis]